MGGGGGGGGGGRVIQICLHVLSTEPFLCKIAVDRENSIVTNTCNGKCYW